MDELTERQKLILTLVIHEYINSAAPVGSQNLVQRYSLDLSSATVRNELGSLTEMGYLRQPHTSAGRIPTEEGYRYFVGRLLQKADLPDSTRRMISHQFYQTHQDMEGWMRLAASILAHQSRGASLVTAPTLEQARLKHLEIISTRGLQALMIVVLVGGEVRQRLLTLEEPASQDSLSALAARLTGRFQGQDAAAIRDAFRRDTQEGTPDPASLMEKRVLAWLLEELGSGDVPAAGEVYLDGLTNVMAEPEFSSSEEARRALRMLEERTALRDLLGRTILSAGPGGVQVLIGGEGVWDDLRQVSLVLASYGAPGLATGALGVLGPMRMSYGRTISTVRFLSTLMSDLIAETMMGE